MKNSIRAICVLGFVCPVALADTAAPVWPSGAMDKKDPRVLAFYDAQCNRWADTKGLAGDPRESYLAKCKTNAAKVYPVGYAPPSVGGGE